MAGVLNTWSQTRGPRFTPETPDANMYRTQKYTDVLLAFRGGVTPYREEAHWDRKQTNAYHVGGEAMHEFEL